MRANALRVDTDDTSIDGFVRLLDDFAAAPVRPPAQRARRNNGRPQARALAPTNAITWTTLSRTRAGFAALLLLLAGGLGIAIWAGPQNCHDCDDALMVAPSAQASGGAALVSRLEYTTTADLGDMLIEQPSRSVRDWSTPSKKVEVLNANLPAIAAAQAKDSIAASPITTSATGRLFEPKPVTEAKPPRHSDLLPAAAAVVLDSVPKALKPREAAEVQDSAPEPLKLSAATDITEEVDVLPSVVAVEQASVNKVAAIDIPIRKPETSGRKSPQLKSQRSRKTARTRKKVRARKAPKTVNPDQVVPRWAEKMYDGSWQNKAFAYQ